MDFNIDELVKEVATEKATAVSKRTYFFHGTLKEVSARKSEDGTKAFVRMTFAVIGHPYRNTYIKEVSANYLIELLPLLNSYLPKADRSESLNVLLKNLITKNVSIKMWSSSYFDKAKDKYVTDAGFIQQ